MSATLKIKKEISSTFSKNSINLKHDKREESNQDEALMDDQETEGHDKDMPLFADDLPCLSGAASFDVHEDGPDSNNKSFVAKCRHGIGGRLPPWIKTVFMYDHETFVLSFRVATSMTIASLFTLCFPPDNPYPYAEWVVTSAGVVSWQSSPDTASAVKRAVERTIGTAIGALLGLAVGFMSAPAEDKRIQASILGILIAMLTFVVPYASIRFGLGDSYAARLGALTFGIVANSFFLPQSAGPVWEAGVFRAANILIGCAVAVFSLLLWPQSTKTFITEKIQAQMLLAGDTTTNVLDLAYESFVNKRSPVHWESFILLESTTVADAAYEAYTKAMGSWKSCNELFPMLKYDPFFLTASERERAQFQDHMMLRSQRAFRMQVNLIMLDSIVRGGVCLDEYKDCFEVLQDVGKRIKVMLDLKNDFAEREAAVLELLETDLVKVRLYVQRLRAELAQLPNGDANLKRMRRSLSSFTGSRPLQLLEGREQVALFFALVEHLIIRAARLHYFCQEL